MIFLFLFNYCSKTCASDLIQRRALIIGIDFYDPTGSGGRWKNLDGCTNDAIAIKEVLISRFDFKDKDIEILINQEASRQSILNGFQELLINSSKGDIAVIYFAGHGSQVKNSLSSENDKHDESIVPADSYFGAKDIRDKELARIFNQFIGKGVVLSVVFDCCHSGSIGRGTISSSPPKIRRILPDDSYDALDSAYFISPEQKGVLIMSASQDFGVAAEQKDDDGVLHGAFTVALLQTLKSTPAKSSASDVFASIRAILKYNGKDQEPVLAATDFRKKQTLFGIDKALLSGKTMVAVIQTDDSEITLQGGIALGIYPKSELVRKNKNGNLLLVKVTTIDGLNKCKGNLISGDISDIKPGDLFELKSWLLPDNSALNIYIPNSLLHYSQLSEIFTLQEDLEKTGEYQIIKDPFKYLPKYTIFLKLTDWYVNMPYGEMLNLGSRLEKKKITKLIPPGSSIFISLPPTKEIYETLIKKFKGISVINTVPTPADALYLLSGRWENDVLEYAFIMPPKTFNDTTIVMPLPSSTDYFSVTNNSQSTDKFVDNLYEKVLKLAKINAWLTLSGPPDDGSFPFYLRLQNITTKKDLYSGDKVKKGNILKLILEADSTNLSEWNGFQRYVYIFSIDSNGKMQLIYPLSGSVENRMPLLSPSRKPALKMDLSGVSLKVSEPFGIDSYFLLSTDEPFPDPGIFNQEGVKTKGIDFKGLENLIKIGTITRGEILTPTNWGIQKFILKSVEN